VVGPDSLEGLQCSLARVGKAAEVLLGGRDLPVAEAVHDHLEVCAAAEQPRRVGAAEDVPGVGAGDLFGTSRTTRCTRTTLRLKSISMGRSKVDRFEHGDGG
jgi:hypothetical protein